MTPISRHLPEYLHVECLESGDGRGPAFIALGTFAVITITLVLLTAFGASGS